MEVIRLTKIGDGYRAYWYLQVCVGNRATASREFPTEAAAREWLAARGATVDVLNGQAA